MHAWAVAESEAQFCLELLLSGDLGGSPRLAEVVGHRFFAQHVFAGFERGAGQLVVRMRRGDDVDDIDIVPADKGLPVVSPLLDVELGGECLGALALDVTDCDNLTAIIALPAGNMGGARPRSSAENRYP